MNSPFTHLNAAAIRDERTTRLRRRAKDAITLAALLIAVLVVADMALTTALALPDLAAQAAALKGM